MDSMITSAPIGYAMMMHYDRNEINNPQTITCKNCDGSGREFISSCCGEQVIDQKCSHCGDNCIINIHKCEGCNGEGEIEL